MRICGLQKLSMVDYPEKLAATVFTGGCNLRCPFCHNAPLVLRAGTEREIPLAEVMDFLRLRQGLLDGVVLSGGEPLLWPDAADFLAEVRKLGFCTKLDTNGSFPDALSDILARGVVDYVAVDVKNSREKYAEAVGAPFDTDALTRSVEFLRAWGGAFELRTTVVHELHTAQDIVSIGEWFAGAPRYFLQRFVDSGDLIGAGLHAPEEQQMREFAALAAPYFGKVELRGI
ncbi:MAG: anaerobic ribonucleoside-triphosphate reductase activating protein [Oscillospiraceae bacterium]|nr:anaerobic ribonucleoside-triphosphate reductase activating protein [Oscillospiraceae bacterium]